ncbi:hypothetical protein ABT301_05550 [Streptomyces sp. NPDC000987]|uniref:hypothetical protein n=1 Tax=Streptomyces sp. NPDC000987 TaxID=3154374 RepID=UPI00331C8C67
MVVAAASVLAAGTFTQAAGAAEETASSSARAVSGVAAAAVPAGFADWDAVMREQQRLNRAATAIQNAAQKTEGDSGLAGIRVKPEDRRVVVYWYGAVPQTVRKVMDRQRTKVPVKVVSARYSRAELLNESHRLQAAKDLAQIAPRVDGSGLDVKLAAHHRKSTSSPTVRELAARSRVNVTVNPHPVTIGSGAVETARPVPRASKHSLTTWTNPCPTLNYFPYYVDCRAYEKANGPRAGARLMECTNGFTIITGTGQYRVLIAAHCGQVGDPLHRIDGTVAGLVEVRDEESDTAITNVSGPRNSMWIGNYKSVTAKTVAGASASFVDNLVCTSGAHSGEVCNIRVTETGLFANFPDGTVHGPFVRALQQDGLSAGGSGDSGGPVFEYVPGQSYVLAKGVFNGSIAGAPVQCNDPLQATCSADIMYADITETLKRFGARIAT